MARLTQQQLETHLWGAANILRGRTAGQDYKTYILSLMFFKRLCDQFDCVNLPRFSGHPDTAPRGVEGGRDVQEEQKTEKIVYSRVQG
jgi:hypothetical protein